MNNAHAKLAKRAELPRVKLEYASNCRAPIWHRVEVGRAQLDRVRQARVKKDAPKWTDSDKCGVPPQFVGMEIFTLARDLVSCGVNHVTVCQVLRRNSWRNFSYQEGANRVSGINEFLLAACSEPGKVAFWKHRGLWQEGAELFRHDGVHYNSLGNFKLYKSVRGAIFQAGRLCQPLSLVVSTKYNVGPTCIIIMCTY